MRLRRVGPPDGGPRGHCDAAQALLRQDPHPREDRRALELAEGRRARPIPQVGAAIEHRLGGALDDQEPSVGPVRQDRTGPAPVIERLLLDQPPRPGRVRVRPDEGGVEGRAVAAEGRRHGAEPGRARVVRPGGAEAARERGRGQGTGLVSAQNRHRA